MISTPDPDMDVQNPTDAMRGPQPGPPLPPSPTPERPVGRLGTMIGNLATSARPVLREVTARAAELAAKVGEAAGPLAHRGAAVTEGIGARVADKGRAIASDLRRDPSVGPRSSARATETTLEPPRD